MGQPCGCCNDKCRTLYRLKADGSTQWEADFFFDWTGASPPGNESTQPPSTSIGQCDVDSDGNFYQVGMPSQPLAIPGHTQQPMYTLRSWDKKGHHRWSWSEAPLGVHQTIPFVATLPPSTLVYCRCSGSIVIVQDGSYMTTGLDGSTGNVLWRQQMPVGYKLAGAGPTRALFVFQRREVTTTLDLFNSNPGQVIVNWMTVRSSDGATMSTVPYTSGAYGWQYFGTAPDLGHQSAFVAVAMDTDDTVYAAQVSANAHDNPYDASGVNLWHFGGTWWDQFGICTFGIDESIPSPATKIGPVFGLEGFNNFAGFAGAETVLNGVLKIVLSASSIYVFSLTGANPSGNIRQGIAVLDKGSFQPNFYQCFRFGTFSVIATGIDMTCFFATDDKITLFAPTGGVFATQAIFNAVDLSQWKVWDVTGTPITPGFIGVDFGRTFIDARPLSDGGSVWSQLPTCIDHVLINDTRNLNIQPCPSYCNDKCYSIEGMTAFTGPDGNSYEGPSTLAPNCLQLMNQAYGFLGRCFWSSAQSIPGGSIGIAVDPLRGVNVAIYLGVAGSFATLVIQSYTELFCQEFFIDPPTECWQFNQVTLINAQYQCNNWTDEGPNVFVPALEPGFGLPVDGVYNWGGGGPGSNPIFKGSLPFTLSKQTGATVPWPTLTLNVSACGQPTVGAGIPECWGHQYFTSVDNGGGFEWIPDGVDNCSPGCSAGGPVTIPTAAGQRTFTVCT